MEVTVTVTVVGGIRAVERLVTVTVTVVGRIRAVEIITEVTLTVTVVGTIGAVEIKLGTGSEINKSNSTLFY